MELSTYMTVVLLAITLMLQIPSIKGTFFQPIAYTFPNGLSSVNGSSSTGGCQPENCIMMPISGTFINGCVCPGTTPVSGVLIDGVIPSIDTTQRGTWASELFVVNRNGRDSFVIGFEFSSYFFLRNIEVAYFDCQKWGAGVSTVNVNFSYAFPSFSIGASTNIGRLSLIEDTSQNCTSLRTVSIPVQPTGSNNIYYIHFTFEGGTSIRPLDWLHLAEIRFSDMEPPVYTTTSLAPSSPTTAPVTITTKDQLLSTSTSNNNFTTSTDNNEGNQTTVGSPIDATSVSTIVTSTVVAASTVPVSIIVGALVGVILLLILLILVCVALVSCFIFYNKRHLQSLEVRKLQYIVTENPTNDCIHELDSFTKLSEENRASVAINHHYRPAGEFLINPSNNPPVIPGSPESDLYTEIRDVGEKGRSRSAPANTSSGLYDAIPESNYADIPELYSKAAPIETPTHQAQDVKQEVKQDVALNADDQETGGTLPEKKPNYTLIQKQPPPPVPEKSSNLKEYLDLKVQPEDAQNQGQVEQREQLNGDQTEKERHYSVIQETDKYGKRESINNKHYAKGESMQSQVPTIEVVPVGIYSEVGEEMKGENDVDFYTDMQGNRTPSRSPSRSRLSSCGSGPIPLSKPLCDTMEDNPTYDTSGSLLHAFISHGEDIYTDPDVKFQADSQQAIYEAVYSDSSVRPSIFKQQMDQQRSNDSKKESKQSAANSDSEEEEEEKVAMYAPIYVLSETSSQPKRQPLTVTNDHIHGVKVLGTGFFGKVVLADTVGLSLKDLNLSDHDDDKSVSIRVAIKKLKRNASETTREAFEKEYKFMSRLDHPNVIRTLGVCTTDPSQFIMMEYMERGDLNNYLTKFEMIIIDGVPKDKEILVGTLVYMCTQIASAMKYLISRNFIHRDLAARNCLVGADYLIKLADFGMSRSLYESHYYIIRGQAVLPVRWMAAECFYGKFSAKTDVWAFGVTMWEIFMLAKERPYSEMEDLEVVDDAIEKEERTLLQQPEHCPDDVFEVMMKCWASDPKDRATFEELRAALSQLSIKSVDDSTI